jgi:hypothetical protein
LISDVNGGTQIEGTGARRDEMTEVWIKLHYELFYNLYSLPSKIELSSHVQGMYKKSNAYRLLVGKPVIRPSSRGTTCLGN